jgi:hypothetical protein
MTPSRIARTALVILILFVAAWSLMAILPQLRRSETPPPENTSSGSLSFDPTQARTEANSILSRYAQYPFLNLIPVDVAISSTVTSSQGLEYEGIRFDVPWLGQPAVQTRRDVGTLLTFTDGNFIMLANPFPDRNTLEEFMSSATTSEERNALYSIFGSTTLQSNWSFFNLVLSSNPEVLQTASVAPSTLLEQSILLPIKLTLFYDTNTQAVYRMSVGAFHVLEITDLPVRLQSYLYIFDSSNNGRLITTSAGQNDIDIILSSMREE